jgi:Ca-activated chloride channel homolog
MKTKITLLALLILSCVVPVCGQGTLKGKVTDGKNPIPYANVIVVQGGKQFGGAQTDLDGNYIIKPIPPGKYDVKATYVGYKASITTGVLVNANKITFLDLVMVLSTNELQAVEVSYTRPLIDKDNTQSGESLSSESIKRVPGRSAQSVSTSSSGVSRRTGGKSGTTSGESMSSQEIKRVPGRVATPMAGVQGNDGAMGRVRGARADGTVTYIDGVKVAGTSSLPKSAIEEVSMVMGGVPAKYEDGKDMKNPKYEPPTISFPSPAPVPAPTSAPVQYTYNYSYENTEEYAKIVENEFLSTRTEPQSTFSIDVDQAAYSNARRFLDNGNRVPKNSVRLEEMINYFSYSYPQPKNDEAFSITTEYADCPWNSTHKLLLVGVQGKIIPVESLPPTSLTFLIDVSGSMGDNNKLPLVKKSLEMLVKQMRPQDKIAIVIYAGETGVALESTYCTPDNKHKIINSIENLTSGGSTAGASGIDLAYKMAADNLMKEGNNRIILCTDGDFNVGISSDDELVRMIEEKRNKGIFLSILGYGMGNYKDSKMEKLADKGNGNYAYIDDIGEARKVLCDQLSATLLTIAKDVKIQIEFNPTSVMQYRLLGYEDRMLETEDFSNDAKDAGEIGSGASVTAIYEIIPANSELRDSTAQSLKYQQVLVVKDSAVNKELGMLKIRYKKPNENTSKLIETTMLNNSNAFENSSNNLKFASAVASFGMLLRDSKFKGNTTFKTILSMAKSASENDENRIQFLSMVKNAEEIYK